MKFYKNRLNLVKYIKALCLLITKCFTCLKFKFLRKVYVMSKENLSIGDVVRFDLHKAKQILTRFEYEFLISRVNEGCSYTIRDIIENNILIDTGVGFLSFYPEYLIKVKSANDRKSTPNQTTIGAIKESRELLSTKQSNEEYTFVPKEEMIPVIVDGISGYLIKKDKINV